MPLFSAVDHYELSIFEMRIIGWTSGADGQPMPIYLRSWSLSTTATGVEVDPPVGGLVSWEGMWSAAWTLQPPSIVAVTLAGNRSDQGCP